MQRLAPEVWRASAARHLAHLAPYTRERLERSAQHVKHPINDFLFDYFSFRPAHLLRWSPGTNVLLENAQPSDLEWNQFREYEDGLMLSAEDFPAHRRSFVTWAINYLEAIETRPSQFGCFGLHEWAMVYRESQIRHSAVPLRLTPDEIADVVEFDGVRCTHYDAFRFFTPLAMPLNRLPLTRETTTMHDQKGCVHVTMDLYKYAYKIAPWSSSDVIADAFLLAWEARQLDMRASPYDLRSFGLEPICIETREGRETYVAMQSELTRKAEPIRAHLLAVYRALG